jgi:hypothetical protein
MIAFLIVLLAAAVLLYAVIMSGIGKKKHRPHRNMASSRGSRGYVDSQEVGARWSTIMATSAAGASGLKSAVNEADKLFDHVLKQLAIDGDTMGERLKNAKSRFSDYSVYDGVWRAHKLRNSLAHDIGFDLVPSQAKDALKGFEEGLRALKAIS